MSVRNFYETTAYGVTSIVVAATPGKARYATYQAMREAGYRVDLCKVRICVRRRRDMDGSTTKTGGIPVEGKCLSPDLFATDKPAAVKYDPPRDDDAERERAATDKWRFGGQTEAERAYYNAPRGRP